MKRILLAAQIIAMAGCLTYGAYWRYFCYKFHDQAEEFALIVELANSNTANALNAAIAFETAFKRSQSNIVESETRAAYWRSCALSK